MRAFVTLRTQQRNWQRSINSCTFPKSLRVKFMARHTFLWAILTGSIPMLGIVYTFFQSLVKLDQSETFPFSEKYYMNLCIQCYEYVFVWNSVRSLSIQVTLSLVTKSEVLIVERDDLRTQVPSSCSNTNITKDIEKMSVRQLSWAELNDLFLIVSPCPFYLYSVENL